MKTSSETLPPSQRAEADINCCLRPEIFHRVELGDEAQVGLPRFALVILEEPQRPSVRGRTTGATLQTRRNPMK